MIILSLSQNFSNDRCFLKIYHPCPVGSSFAPYSTRGGVATAAYAIVAPDGRIVAFLSHKRRDTVTAHTHFIDALVEPCPVARRFFDCVLPLS